MPDFHYWPRCYLGAYETVPVKVPFTRGGGRTLGGIERKVRTDRGFWRFDLNRIVLRTPDQKRYFNALGVDIGGEAGLVVIPVSSWDTAPFASGRFEPSVLTPHDDDSPFDDDSEYVTNAIDVVMHEAVAISATVVKLRINTAAPKLEGVRFSYNNALYETGIAISVEDDVWEVPIFPSIRAAIPEGAALEFDNPTCLVHLENDRGMDVPQGRRGRIETSVSFVEAVDYWNDLATA